MPAEWERHEATWIGWPHNSSDWPGKLSTIHWVYTSLVEKLSKGERVRILVNSKAHELKARALLNKSHVDLSQVDFYRFVTDRGWSRDFGPIFVKDLTRNKLTISRFRFNGWAKYPNWHKDNQIPVKIAKKLNIPLVPVQHENRIVVLEGGSIDVNGRGTLITTEECLLDRKVQARNPNMNKKDIEAILKSSLGAKKVLWLGKGIEGDDTHGHIDDICRFVNPNTVVFALEENPKDKNYRPLQENLERLQGMTLEDGSQLNVVKLPMPEPIYFENYRLPASYANFYISNSAVLVPTFNDKNDQKAVGILSELFEDRPVIGIHALDLVWGFGTLHCLTQQQPQ